MDPEELAQSIGDLQAALSRLSLAVSRSSAHDESPWELVGLLALGFLGVTLPGLSPGSLVPLPGQRLLGPRLPRLFLLVRTTALICVVAFHLPLLSLLRTGPAVLGSRVSGRKPFSRARSLLLFLLLFSTLSPLATWCFGATASLAPLATAPTQPFVPLLGHSRGQILSLTASVQFPRPECIASRLVWTSRDCRNEPRGPWFRRGPCWSPVCHPLASPRQRLAATSCAMPSSHAKARGSANSPARVSKRGGSLSEFQPGPNNHRSPEAGRTAPGRGRRRWRGRLNRQLLLDLEEDALTFMSLFHPVADSGLAESFEATAPHMIPSGPAALEKAREWTSGEHTPRLTYYSAQEDGAEPPPAPAEVAPKRVAKPKRVTTAHLADQMAHILVAQVQACQRSRRCWRPPLPKHQQAFPTLGPEPASPQLSQLAAALPAAGLGTVPKPKATGILRLPCQKALRPLPRQTPPSTSLLQSASKGRPCLCL